jgi:hypothetical protein
MGQMNPLIRDILESLLRKGSTAIATYLVTMGLLTEGQATEVVAGLVLLGVSIAWSIYQRYKDRLVLLTAIEAPPGTSEKQVKELAKLPDAPSTLGVLLAVALSTSVVFGCAMRGKPPERQVAIISLQVISGVDAVAKTSEELHTSKVLTDGQYKAVVTRLREVYAQTSRLADALKAYDTVASTDAASQVTAALNALAVLVPNLVADVTGPAGQKLAALVGEVNKLLIAIAQAVQPAPTARVNLELHSVGGVLWVV